MHKQCVSGMFCISAEDFTSKDNAWPCHFCKGYVHKEKCSLSCYDTTSAGHSAVVCCRRCWFYDKVLGHELIVQSSARPLPEGKYQWEWDPAMIDVTISGDKFQASKHANLLISVIEDIRGDLNVSPETRSCCSSPMCPTPKSTDGVVSICTECRCYFHGWTCGVLAMTTDPNKKIVYPTRICKLCCYYAQKKSPTMCPYRVIRTLNFGHRFYSYDTDPMLLDASPLYTAIANHVKSYPYRRQSSERRKWWYQVVQTGKNSEHPIFSYPGASSHPPSTEPRQDSSDLVHALETQALAPLRDLTRYADKQYIELPDTPETIAVAKLPAAAPPSTTQTNNPISLLHVDLTTSPSLPYTPESPATSMLRVRYTMPKHNPNCPGPETISNCPLMEQHHCTAFPLCFGTASSRIAAISRCGCCGGPTHELSNLCTRVTKHGIVCKRCLLWDRRNASINKTDAVLKKLTIPITVRKNLNPGMDDLAYYEMAKDPHYIDA